MQKLHVLPYIGASRELLLGRATRGAYEVSVDQVAVVFAVLYPCSPRFVVVVVVVVVHVSNTSMASVLVFPLLAVPKSSEFVVFPCVSSTSMAQPC